MVPKFEEFFLPCLKCLSDGNTYTQEMLRKYIIDYFHLSDSDVNTLIKSGKKTQVADRVSWTVSYFLQAGLIDAPKRGYYTINKAGLSFLAEHKNGFNKGDLLQIPSFSTFATPKTKEDKNLTQKDLNPSAQEESTPTDLIADAHRQINETLAKDLLSKIMESSPEFFERLVVELLVKMGYGGSFEDAAKVTQYTHDDGIDGVIKEDKLGFDTIYLQAKRWSANIGSVEIQKFIGALNFKHASKGVFITTSKFSDKVKKSVESIGGLKIILIDGEQLCKYMIEYNLGVTVRQTYEIKQLDNDYFTEE